VLEVSDYGLIHRWDARHPRPSKTAEVLVEAMLLRFVE